MGGKEASRGFIYQGFAAVLEALTQDGWDKIYVEFPTAEDKVDIALEYQGQTIKAIQVKSTINTFSEASIITWINDLVADVSSSEYHIFLIGQCEKSAVTFLNALLKYQNHNLDKTSNSALESFDTDILDKNKITYSILPFDIKSLLSIVQNSMHKYISTKKYKISYDQLEILSDAVFSTQMLLSTDGSSITKEVFDAKIFKWFELMGGSALQKIIASATHKIQFYDLNEKIFSDTIAPLSLTAYKPYKEYILHILDECRKYIEKISKIDLLPYTGDIPKTVEVDVKKLLTDKDLFSKLSAPVRAELKDAEKDRIIEKAKCLLDIDIHSEFFDVGNLTLKYNLWDRNCDIIGENIEKEKYELINKLSFEFTKYEVAQLFSETFSAYILLPLTIINSNSVMDKNITVKIFIDNDSAITFNTNEYPNNDYSHAFADYICSKKLIDIFFDLPISSHISKEDEIFFEPISFPNPLSGDYKFTSEDFYISLAKNIANATIIQEKQKVYEFTIDSLRPNEIKWLSRIIILKPLKKDIQISYQVLSNQSDGTLSGTLCISK